MITKDETSLVIATEPNAKMISSVNDNKASSPAKQSKVKSNKLGSNGYNKSEDSVASVSSRKSARGRFDLAQCFSSSSSARNGPGSDSEDDFYRDAEEESFRNYKPSKARQALLQRQQMLKMQQQEQLLLQGQVVHQLGPYSGAPVSLPYCGSEMAVNGGGE